MSTRYYPLYAKGCPQLRVFLPNFWMKLVKPEEKLPPNQVQFIVSMEMTKFDVKNYLEKIYKVPVVDVRTHVKMGEIRKQHTKGYIVKDDDYKIANVTLHKDQIFEFPNIFPESKRAEEKKDLESLENAEKEFKKMIEKNSTRPDIPSWFGL